MPEIPDLAKIKDTPANEGDGKVVQVAFLVYRENTGKWMFTADVNAPIIPMTSVCMDDIYSGCSVVLRDLSVSQTVQNIINVQQQIGQRVMEQQQAQGLMSALGNMKPGR